MGGLRAGITSLYGAGFATGVKSVFDAGFNAANGWLGQGVNELFRAGAHGLTQAGAGSIGAAVVGQDANFRAAFASGAMSSLVGHSVGHGVDKALAETINTTGIHVAMGAIVGGTASKLAGGKFLNGAMTGAVITMFNLLAHQGGRFYRTDKGTSVETNKLPPSTVIPTGETADALERFADATGLDNVLVTGGSEIGSHSSGSFHDKNLAVDIAGPRFNNLTHNQVREAARSAGFTHIVFEDKPGFRADHWHLQIGAGNGLNDQHSVNNPDVFIRVYNK